MLKGTENPKFLQKEERINKIIPLDISFDIFMLMDGYVNIMDKVQSLF